MRSFAQNRDFSQKPRMHPFEVHEVVALVIDAGFQLVKLVRFTWKLNRLFICSPIKSDQDQLINKKTLEV